MTDIQRPTMFDERITNPRAAFLAGYEEARHYFGREEAGKRAHGAECDKVANPDYLCTCDEAGQKGYATQLAEEMTGPDPRRAELPRNRGSATMADEKITDPRAAFVAGYMQARDDHGIPAADGKPSHGVECDKARNDCNRCTCDAVGQGACAIEHAAQQTALDPRHAELEQRAIVAEMALAAAHVEIETLQRVRDGRRAADQRERERSKRNADRVDAGAAKLAAAVSTLAGIYGMIQEFENAVYDFTPECETRDEALLPMPEIIPVLAEFLERLVVADHPSVSYPVPGQRTVRVAEAAARGVLGAPGGTVTEAVLAALQAAAELRRTREQRGEGEPDADGPDADAGSVLRPTDDVWVRGWGGRWCPGVVMSISPDGEGDVVVVLLGTEDAASTVITMPRCDADDSNIRPRGRDYDSLILTPRDRDSMAITAMVSAERERRDAVCDAAARIVQGLDGTMGRTPHQVATELRDVGDGWSQVGVNRVAVADLVDSLAAASVPGWWSAPDARG